MYYRKTCLQELYQHSVTGPSAAQAVHSVQSAQLTGSVQRLLLPP